MLANYDFSLVLYLIFFNECFCFTAKFFSHSNFEGFLHEAKPSNHCSNLPNRVRRKAFSVNTDTCIMVYEQPDCLGKSLQIPSTQEDSAGKNLSGLGQSQTFHNMITSFRLCSAGEGGIKVNVDIYGQPKYKNHLAVFYKDMCQCENIPDNAIDHVGSIDNHGNCVRLYFAKHCKGAFKNLVGGRSQITENLRLFYYRESSESLERYWLAGVVSLAPCRISSACRRLKAVAFKYEYLPTITTKNLGKIVMEAKSSIRNNGTAKITQEISHTKSIQESFEIKRGNTLTKMSTIENENSVVEMMSATVGVEAGIESGILSAKSNLQFTAGVESHLRSLNSNSKQTEVNNEDTKRQEKSREFTVKQTIEIAPCTLYEMSSYVNVLQDVPINYTVYYKVTGSAGETRLTTAEIRKDNAELDVVENYDEFTVIAKSVGFMKVTLGLEAVIDGHGDAIKNCAEKDTRLGLVAGIILLLAFIFATIVYLWRKRKSSRYTVVPPPQDKSKNIKENPLLVT